MAELKATFRLVITLEKLKYFMPLGTKGTHYSHVLQCDIALQRPPMLYI